MRRLLAALAAAWTAHGPPGPAAGQARDTAVYDLVQLAPGVYVSDVRPRPPASAFANSLVVVGGRGVLVVDAHHSPAAARALIAAIRGVPGERTPGPVASALGRAPRTRRHVTPTPRARQPAFAT